MAQWSASGSASASGSSHPVLAPTGDGASDSASLDTYVTDYRYENGRRYHAYKDGAYWGPNDDHANEGHDLTHALYHQTTGSLHLSPLRSPRQILDIGTGTGIWAIEMADTYPSAQVTGIDLSPIQPELVPPNCIFEVDDAEMEWTWPAGTIDFVHVREMLGSVGDLEKLARQAFASLRPGGWVEWGEHGVDVKTPTGPLPSSHFFTTWSRTLTSLAGQRGKPLDVHTRTADLLRDAGFVDVEERKYIWPVGQWHEDEHLQLLGSMNQTRALENCEAFGLRLFTQTGKWTVERSQVFLAEMRRALRNPNARAYQDVTIAFGRKPG